ncbi:MAG: hypothetical protein QOE66_191, partial [Chloroflexota bacterium]|nr:hypothetical protein [Chloroflexota bacterium]
MTFWNGADWGPEAPVARRRGPGGRARDWAATVIMIVVAGIYVMPFA